MVPGAPMFGQQVPQAYAPQPQGVTPGLPYNAGGFLPPQQQFPFPMPGQMPAPNGQQPGGQPNGHQPPQQQPGQQSPQGGGGQQTGGGDGTWDKPYPQKPLAEMSDPEQLAYWKYHHRKSEDRLRAMGDYDQLKQQLASLQQMTQTEWQRAVLEAEQRGTAKAMEVAAGQMVSVAFQGAANQRMTPDQIHAALQRLDAKSFVTNGQVDIAAIHQYVDTIAPPRQNGLVPLLPQQGQQQLPLQQVALGYQQPLQPGQPGYGQQPTFGPLGQQPPGQQFTHGQQFTPQQSQVPVLSGQVMPSGYGQVPIPGVPPAYQPAAQVPQPVVQAAGLHGLPGLTQHPGLPAATDFGQGPAIPGAPVNAQQSGAQMAAARHGKTRSQQLAQTRGL